MKEIHEKELTKMKSKVKDLKLEIDKMAKNRRMSLLDMKRGFDLIHKEAELMHNINHIEYPELDKTCKCGYKAPMLEDNIKVKDKTI